jgi:hypothetical protein
MDTPIPTTTNVECSIAETPEALRQVYGLRYRCYRRKGSIDERENEQFHDSFDEKPNSFSFLCRNADADALATVRISVVAPELGWTDSPVCHVYGDDPAFQQIQGESFVEASRLCFGPQARRDSFIRLVGNMAALAEFHGVQWLVACPRVEHSPVYQRLFGFPSGGAASILRREVRNAVAGHSRGGSPTLCPECKTDGERVDGGARPPSYDRAHRYCVSAIRSAEYLLRRPRAAP